MKKNIVLSLGLALSIGLFNGCSSDDKKSNEEPKTVEISGSVIDPAIVGATVRLECANKTYNASEKTDAQGKFTIATIPGGVDLSRCTLVSTGGSDGDDFTNLTLKAPYKLFDGNEIYVTPFTTLVAEYDDAENMENAKQKVADFLGIDPTDLLKNPTSSLDLAKVSKKIVKIALSKDANGEIVGILDMDDLNEDNLVDYINFGLDIPGENKENLQNIISSIDDATDANAIQYQIIKENVFAQLKGAYQQISYDETKKANLEFLAQKITEANKDDNTYQNITKHHIRKALHDVELIPTSSGIDATIGAILDYNTTAFEAHIGDKIDIKDIEGIVLFNSNNHEQILGDDNQKRRNYYIGSDKSQIAKIAGLTSDTYNDQTNDAINGGVSLGLANFGSGVDALEHINSNVYTYDERLKSYEALGEILKDLGEYDQSAEAYKKYFEAIKQNIEALGSGNIFGDEPGRLLDIVSSLSEMEKEEDLKEVLTYYLEFAESAQSTTTSVAGYVYYELIRNVEILSRTEYENNRLESAKKYAKIAAKKSVDIATVAYGSDYSSFAVRGQYKASVNAMFFEENGAATAAATTAAGLNKTDDMYDITDWYQLHITYEALNGNVDSSIKKFLDLNTTLNQLGTPINKTYAPEDVALIQRQNLELGYAAALYVKGKEDILFDTIYTNADIYDMKSQISTHINKDNTDLTTTLGIELLGGKDKLKEYLDRLYTLMETWSITDDEEAQKVYANDDGSGYLALANYYKDPSKAKEVLDHAYAKIDALTNTKHKINGLINILQTSTDLELETNEGLWTSLKTATEMSSVDDIKTLIRASSIFASNGKKSDAISILNTAYSKVPTLASNDLTNIKERTESLVGHQYSGEISFVKNSIAYGYYLAGDANKANNIVKEAFSGIDILDNTADKYKLLIPVATSFGLLNSLDYATITLAKIHTKQEKGKATRGVASGLAQFDAFVHKNIASIDSDNDGKPDFFNKDATQTEIDASGLTLDDDIDGDGKLDSVDTLPYDKVK